jgi:hypothetical protein
MTPSQSVRTGGALDPTEPTRSLPALVALALAGGLLVLATGVYGLVGAVVLAIVWVTASTVTLFAASQIVVAATLPATASLTLVLAIEAPLLALLLVPAAETDTPLEDAASVALPLVVLGGLAVGAYLLVPSIWLVGLLLGGLTLPTGYYLHRYTRVRLHDHGATTGADPP